MSPQARFLIVFSILTILALIVVLALEQDRLNARIRALEIHAGFGDKWVDTVCIDDAKEVMSVTSLPADPLSGTVLYFQPEHKIVTYGNHQWYTIERDPPHIVKDGRCP